MFPSGVEYAAKAGLARTVTRPGTLVTPEPASNWVLNAPRYCWSDAAWTNPIPSTRRCARFFSSPIARGEASYRPVLSSEMTGVFSPLAAGLIDDTLERFGTHEGLLSSAFPVWPLWAA